MCERFNRTLLNMLGTLGPERKSNWKEHVGPLVHAYNATRHDTTGQAPFYLMFRRQPRLPVDLVLGVPEEGEKNYGKYITSLRDRLEEAYRIAAEHTEKNHLKQKQNFDV